MWISVRMDFTRTKDRNAEVNEGTRCHQPPLCTRVAMPQPQQAGQDWQLGSALELLSAQQSLHPVIKHQEVCQAALGCLSYGAGWRFQPANT